MITNRGTAAKSLVAERAASQEIADYLSGEFEGSTDTMRNHWGNNGEGPIVAHCTNNAVYTKPACG